MEDLFVREKKKTTKKTKKKTKQNRNITTVESIENAYHVTRQDLHSVHTPYNKNKN